ncbi:MAG: hypothetical protein JWO08_4686 [Verrucomicrobiaceae bacterium]|nr:hypothetical protein [Verrucomicrobiaceae bacterium]
MSHKFGNVAQILRLESDLEAVEDILIFHPKMLGQPAGRMGRPFQPETNLLSCGRTF